MYLIVCVYFLKQRLAIRVVSLQERKTMILEVYAEYEYYAINGILKALFLSGRKP